MHAVRVSHAPLSRSRAQHARLVGGLVLAAVVLTVVGAGQLTGQPPGGPPPPPGGATW